MRDHETNQLEALLNSLKEVYIQEEGEDSRCWSSSTDCIFSVSSFFPAMSNSSRATNGVAGIWKIKAPARVIVFGWLALQGKILTLDNLHKWKTVVVNACPMCLADEESVDHLLLKCKLAQRLWNSVLSWFGLCPEVNFGPL